MRRMSVICLAIVLMLLLPLQSLTPTANAQTLSFEKTWGCSGEDNNRGAARDGSGNIYVAGWTYCAGTSDVLLLKYDASGGLVWRKTWEGTDADYGYDVAVDDSGNNIYVTGYTISFGAGMEDVVLLKFDSSGGLVWQKTWGGNRTDQGRSVAVDGSGNIYVTGWTRTFDTNGDIILLKFNSTDGSLLWQKIWGGTGGPYGNNDYGYAVAVDGSGNVYVTGAITGYGGDVALLKFNSTDGTVLWQKEWSPTNTEGSDYGWDVAVDGSGNNIYVTGSMWMADGYYELVLLKFDSSGGLVWQETWGGAYDDHGRGVGVDPSGNVYVTGWTNSFGAGGYDVVLLKFESTGNLIWQKTWGSTGDDVGYGVALDFGGAYFTGYTSGATRTLSNAYGNVASTSWTPLVPTSTLGTPTLVLGTPTFTLGTPLGSETYAGDKDVFLLRFSTASVSDLAGFTSSPTNSTLLVIGDLLNNPHGTKPAGVNFQIGRDMTPLGFVYGMMTNVQDTMFDTNAAINATSGRPLSSIPQTLIFSIGGPGINSVSHYYETTSNALDRAPIRFSMNATHYIWTRRNGTEVFAAWRSSCSVPPGTNDVFVIQVLRDADGRLVAIMYGTHYTGTWAAAVYFKFVVYPNISGFADSFYIVSWIDTNGDFTPNMGDAFISLVQGS